MPVLIELRGVVPTSKKSTIDLQAPAQEHQYHHRPNGEARDYNQGSWSEIEKLLFLEGLHQYGRGKWKQIGTILTTRYVKRSRAAGGSDRFEASVLPWIHRILPSIQQDILTGLYDHVPHPALLFCYRSVKQIKSHAQKILARQDSGDDIFAPLRDFQAQQSLPVTTWHFSTTVSVDTNTESQSCFSESSIGRKRLRADSTISPRALSLGHDFHQLFSPIARPYMAPIEDQVASQDIDCALALCRLSSSNGITSNEEEEHAPRVTPEFVECM